MQKSIRLAEDLVARLELLQAKHGLNSIADVIAASTTLYERCRAPKEMEAFERLTPRQRQMLALIARGKTSKEIASELAISLKTVDFHMTRLRKALGVRGTALLTRFAVRVGAVEA